MSAPGNTRMIRVKWLLGCCLATVRSHTELTDEGDIIDCDDCGARIKVAQDGMWEWEPPQGVLSIFRWA